MTIKNKKRALNEDFLSDLEQKTVTPEMVAGTEENTVPDDDDFADLLGGAQAAKTPESGEAAAEEKATENLADTVASLKDIVTGLATSVQQMNDNLAKMQQPAPAQEAPAEAPAAEAPAQEAPAAEAPAQEAPAAEPASQDAPPNIDLDLDNAANAGDDEQPAQNQGAEQAPAQEPNTQDKPTGESAEEDEVNLLDESLPSDAEKTDAFRANRKAGKMLNSNSGTIIGIVESGKLYKLDPVLMTIVQSKIRAKIDEAKKALKAELLGEEYKPAEPAPAATVDEKADKSSFKSFIEASKTNKIFPDEKKSCDKGECKEDDKKSEEDKKSDDKKETEEK